MIVKSQSFNFCLNVRDRFPSLNNISGRHDIVRTFLFFLLVLYTSIARAMGNSKSDFTSCLNNILRSVVSIRSLEEPGLYEFRISDNTRLRVWRTNRAISRGPNYTEGYSSMSEIYPREWLEMESLKGKVVLDVGAGEQGRFVRELSNKGVKAVALDRMPFLPNTSNAVQAEMNAIPILNQSVDFIYATSSLAYYADNPPALKEILLEFERVLRHGGAMRLSPFEGDSFATLQKLVDEIPSLRVTQKKGFAIEIKKN